MALQFNGLEPVRFGKIEEEPVVNRELILKIQNGVRTGLTDDTFKEILAEAFPVNRATILDFMKTKMTNYDITRLATYLVGGESMIATLDKAQLENAREGMKEARDERN